MEKIPLPLVGINREMEYEVEKILNRRDVREKPKYLVWWKRYMVEEDTWKGLKKLENMMDLVKEFEKKIREEKMKRV